MKMTVTATRGQTVNLRSSASTDSTILDKIMVGTEVTVLEQGEEWCKIETPKGTGYMMTKYLKDSRTITKADLQKIYDSLSEVLKTIERVLK